MNVSQLIEELKKFPQYYPVMCDVELRYNQSVISVDTAQGDARLGPSVVIFTQSDPRNDPETPEVYRYDGSEP